MPTRAMRVRISRRVVGVAGGFVWAAALIGCPLYEDDCTGNCARGYECEPYSGACVPIGAEPACTRPGQCGAAETCTPEFVCRPGSCTNYGCVSGFQCGVVDGAHACVSTPDAAPPPADAGRGPADASSSSTPISDAAADAAR
jgi:hypothetical protein